MAAGGGGREESVTPDPEPDPGKGLRGAPAKVAEDGCLAGGKLGVGRSEDRYAPVPNCYGKGGGEGLENLENPENPEKIEKQHSGTFTDKIITDKKYEHITGKIRDCPSGRVKELVKVLEGGSKESRGIFKFGEDDSLVESSPLKRRRIHSPPNNTPDRPPHNAPVKNTPALSRPSPRSGLISCRRRPSAPPPTRRRGDAPPSAVLRGRHMFGEMGTKSVREQGLACPAVRPGSVSPGIRQKIANMFVKHLETAGEAKPAPTLAHGRPPDPGKLDIGKEGEKFVADDALPAGNQPAVWAGVATHSPSSPAILRPPNPDTGQVVPAGDQPAGVAGVQPPPSPATTRYPDPDSVLTLPAGDQPADIGGAALTPPQDTWHPDLVPPVVPSRHITSGSSSTGHVPGNVPTKLGEDIRAEQGEHPVRVDAKDQLFWDTSLPPDTPSSSRREKREIITTDRVFKVLEKEESSEKKKRNLNLKISGRNTPQVFRRRSNQI